jgi:hypothetical protein
MDLNQFVTWQAHKPNTRYLTIEAKPGKELSIWVYDSVLGAGQYVETVEEINLEAKKAADEKAEFERLRAKYGEESK